MTVAGVKEKLNLALPFFEHVWSEVFKLQGRTLAPPKVYAYTAATTNACGKVELGNATYCAKDNSIYLDAAFLARLAKSTADETKTDGDYAAIVVAAHEFGHLLRRQLGAVGGYSFAEEQAADCFAGAVTREAQRSGYLEAGDLDEARYALVISGDILDTGYLDQVMGRYRPGAHGTADQRHRAFDRGFYVGAQSCSAELGVPMVRPGGKVLFEDSLGGVKPLRTPACNAVSGKGELAMANVGKHDEELCVWRPPYTAPLPDHYRLEVTARQFRGNTSRGIGLIFGPPLETGANFAGVVRAEGSWALYRITQPVGLVDFLGDSMPDEKTSVIAKGLGANNRLTLDVHHQKGAVNLIFYVNGRFMGMNEGAFGDIDRTGRRDDRAGLLIQLPGMSAAFSAFRIIALPD